MSLKSYDDLNELQLDVLKEICNIGSGNAASSLSIMFDTPLNIEVPSIGIIDFNQAIEKLGGAETVVAGLMLSISGDIEGMMMFILQREFAAMLLKTLMFVEINDFDEIDEIGFSAMNEMANIAAGSFVNAISLMTDLTIDISPPSGTVDMAGAIMNVPAIYCANISDSLLFMENRFILGGEKSPAHILLIPDVESLEKLMGKLGIET